MKLLIRLSLVMMIFSCGSDDATDEMTDVVSADVLADGTSATTSDSETDSSSVNTGPVSKLVVFQMLGFTEASEEGVAPGYNLDGLVSEEGDKASCGHEDYTSPDGLEGVDNQLAKLVPLFELVGLGAAADLVQSTIEAGGILLMLQVDGIDDLKNDDEVTVTIRAGEGVPLLGTDGLVLSGQTFSLHPESPDSKSENGKIVDGVLHAGPFVARLPFLVFGVSYDITLFNAQITARWSDTGDLIDGMVGGGVPVADLMLLGEKAAADDASVLAALKVLLEGNGDLDPDEDGNCRQISAALSFASVSAFLFPESNDK